LLSIRFAIGITFERFDDDRILMTFCVPGFSLYFGFSPPFTSRITTWLPEDDRECRIAIHDWAVWVNPWSKPNEWSRKDPWWVRGLTFHIDDFILGRTKCSSSEVKPPVRVVIDLDGHQYHGTAKFERATWKRPRWFAKVRESVWIDMDHGHGLPHSGKGENSWDCGDDALCGWGNNGLSVGEAIGVGISKVLKYRERYGRPFTVGPRETKAAQ